MAITALAATAHVATDPFSIEEIYETDSGELKWYTEDDDPEPSHDDYDERAFHFGTRYYTRSERSSGRHLKDGHDSGSEEHGGKLHINGLVDKEWQDMEIGYFKFLDSRDQITMIARHGRIIMMTTVARHWATMGMISADGNAYFKKKLYHSDGGYSDKVGAVEDAVDDLENEWIGIKFMAYYVGDNEVKLELGADEGNEKIAEYIDDKELEINSDSDCDSGRDHVIDEAQPRVSFRLDDSQFEFKDLTLGGR